MVELMVAIVITLLLLGIVFLLFDRIYDLGETASAIADANQNIRASINLIARDLTMSGTGIPIGGIPIPNGNGSSQLIRPGAPGSGGGVQYFPAGSVVLSAVTPAWTLGPTVINQSSDEIHLVTVPPNATFVQVPVAQNGSGNAIINAAGSQITFASGPAGIAVGNLIMLTNIVGSALGMVTAIDTTDHTITCNSTDPLRINQPTAAAGKIASLQSGGNYPPTTVSQVQMITYYLDNSDPNSPKLMRELDAGAPQAAAPLATNIVALRFTYDLFDGVTINQPNVTTPNQIRKVNIQVTGRSSQPLRRTRQYFVNTMTTSVTVRNLAYHSRY